MCDVIATTAQRRHPTDADKYDVYVSTGVIYSITVSILTGTCPVVFKSHTILFSQNLSLLFIPIPIKNC